MLIICVLVSPDDNLTKQYTITFPTFNAARPDVDRTCSRHQLRPASNYCQVCGGERHTDRQTDQMYNTF